MEDIFLVERIVVEGGKVSNGADRSLKQSDGNGGDDAGG